jgi:hypothetical protein
MGVAPRGRRRPGRHSTLVLVLGLGGLTSRPCWGLAPSRPLAKGIVDAFIRLNVFQESVCLSLIHLSNETSRRARTGVSGAAPLPWRRPDARPTSTSSADVTCVDHWNAQRWLRQPLTGDRAAGIGWARRLEPHAVDSMARRDRPQLSPDPTRQASWRRRSPPLDYSGGSLRTGWSLNAPLQQAWMAHQVSVSRGADDCGGISCAAPGLSLADMFTQYAML